MSENIQTLPTPGSVIHFLVTGFSFQAAVGFTGAAVVSTRSQNVTITAALVEASFDRNGDSWLALDADAQIEKFGKQVFALGEAPPSMIPWEVGSEDWQMARNQARADAFALIGEPARTNAMRSVEARFSINGGRR